MKHFSDYEELNAYIESIYKAAGVPEQKAKFIATVKSDRRFRDYECEKALALDDYTENWYKDDAADTAKRIEANKNRPLTPTEEMFKNPEAVKYAERAMDNLFHPL